MENSLKRLTNRTVSVQEYLSTMAEPFKSKFFERMTSYILIEEVAEELKKYVHKIFIVVFSAEWCKDCVSNVPILALLTIKTGLNVRVFGGVEKNPSSLKEKWRVPPSPPEIREFEVEKLPHIVIFDVDGWEIGKIVENPPLEKTLEEEILRYLREYYSR